MGVDRKDLTSISESLTAFDELYSRQIYEYHIHSYLSFAAKIEKSQNVRIQGE